MRCYHDPDRAREGDEDHRPGATPDEGGAWGRDIPEDTGANSGVIRVYEDGRWMSWAEWATRRAVTSLVAQPPTEICRKTAKRKKHSRYANNVDQADLF